MGNFDTTNNYMNSEKNLHKTKNILASLLLNIYFIFSCATLTAFLGLYYFNRIINFDMWMILGESVIFLFSGISVITKLRFKNNLIWIGIFDLILFPLAIPFYIQVYKNQGNPINKIEIRHSLVTQWISIQAIVNTVVLLIGVSGWLIIVTASWKETYRNSILGFALFGFLLTLLGTIASWLSYFSIKHYGKINRICLCCSLLLLGFGWVFPLTWLTFKPKIKINNLELIQNNILEFQKKNKKQLD